MLLASCLDWSGRQDTHHSPLHGQQSEELLRDTAAAAFCQSSLSPETDMKEDRRDQVELEDGEEEEGEEEANGDSGSGGESGAETGGDSETEDSQIGRAHV